MLKSFYNIQRYIIHNPYIHPSWRRWLPLSIVSSWFSANSGYWTSKALVHFSALEQHQYSTSHTQRVWIQGWHFTAASAITWHTTNYPSLCRHDTHVETTNQYHSRVHIWQVATSYRNISSGYQYTPTITLATWRRTNHLLHAQHYVLHLENFAT